MQKWEYKLGDIVFRGGFSGLEGRARVEEWNQKIEEEMNKMGAEGWELVGERELSQGIGQMIYKRKLEEG